MSAREHRTLVADTDTTVTVNGNGTILVLNHDQAEEIYAILNTACVVQADDTYSVPPGRGRIVGRADLDHATDVHLRSLGGGNASVEIISEGEEAYLI